ncbi:hypothetical protein G6F50_017019 [Rhizopus delemar]|uniref:Tetratricopeptide repeat protein n=1 Tax=Rhizopus delemar TaxID=936053 RepID=A0A9P6XRB3_9FUNG|nr:hypothetical protein G6F50_017019 [Rhizopus delemar]
MQVGNLDAAERKAREAQKLAPEAPDALVLLAGIDERRGRTPQAGESFRRAAELAPQRGDISTITVPGCASRAGRPSR